MPESLTDHLAEIESAGLIRLAQAEPELEYLFRHGLVQDAAYESLLKHQRADLHARVGAALESLYPDRREEMAGTLARHFENAGESDKAVAYYRMAARRARSMYAYDEAVSFLQTASQISQQDASSPARPEVLEELADLFQIVADGASAIAAYQEALALHRSRASADALTRLRLHRKILQSISGMKWRADYAAFEAAERIGSPSRAALIELMDELSESAPHPETVRALIRLAWDAWHVRDPADRQTARFHAEDAVRLAETLDDPHLESDALEVLGVVFYGEGLLRERVKLAFRRAALARDPRLADLRQRCLIMNDLSNALLHVGDYETAIPYAQEAERIGAAIRDVASQIASLANQAQSLFRLDRWDEMLALDERRRELQRAYPLERVGPTCYEIGLQAMVYALRGQEMQAAGLRDEAFQIMTSIAGPTEAWLRQQHY